MAFWAADLEQKGDWIWHADAVDSRSDNGFFYAAIEIPRGAELAEVFTSSSGRYTLHIDNGDGPKIAGRGPARSDRQHTSLDPFGVHLPTKETRMKLWAMVRFTAGTPESAMGEVHGTTPGFYCVVLFRDAAGSILKTVGTNEKTWRACNGAAAITALNLKDPTQFFAVGWFEHHHSASFPIDWLSRNGTSNACWKNPHKITHAYLTGSQTIPYGGDNFPWLTPRDLPQMEESPATFFAAYDIATDAPPRARSIPATLQLAPNTTTTLLLDAGIMTIGYLQLSAQGIGTIIAADYAEVLYKKAGDKTEKTFTVEQDASASVHFNSAVGDLFDLTSDRAHRFETCHWRAFRFVRLTITTQAAGATLQQVSYLRTGYPHENQFRFSAPGPHADTIQKIVDVSWRTLQCCTWETYMDCPYYEQLQYVGDTRIQALITYVTTGDPTLPIQALRAFDRSRTYEGITQSRYPCSSIQLIPTFSLIYILMLQDYAHFIGDEAIVAELRPGIASILNFFGRLTDPLTGLITRSPYWDFMDWVDGWHAGIAPGNISAMNNLLYLLALEAGSALYDRSKPGSGDLYKARATTLRQRIYDTFFDPALGILHDTPRRVQNVLNQPAMFSQHAQCLAVLADVLTGAEARHAMEQAMLPAIHGIPMKPASFYFRFYVAEALAKLNMGDQIWPLLDVFREALANGSTTWPESLGPTARSECHAWGSWPIYFFARHILGVSPPSLDDQSIGIDPLHVPELPHAEGTIVTYRGTVNVNVRWTGDQREVSFDGPAGTRVIQAKPRG